MTNHNLRETTTEKELSNLYLREDEVSLSSQQSPSKLNSAQE
eukprot:CAMPEP_0168608092 /NCGR_PEP_ID=MMETSP0449_2-20121227/435_1 /TAXON_ID=1082188 /ORGANISM="Strombidium rassoulzadegani, Strain ras09" /LENGTH=41 /DNA_ID= /DNA_START= /DNA_END= /DNA_ORIENTATION=